MDDRGSAPVEFVLVGALLTLLFASLVQLGLLLHVRNVAVADATEGARYAANADRDCADGEQWTREQLAGTVPAAVLDVRCGSDGAGVVTMSVVVRAPVLGLLGDIGTLHLTGHAVDEHQVGP
ncbi:MAG: TadE family protein [Frankiaceae bacterium]